MVWPIMSGKIVDRRDQVFKTFFSFRVFNASTLTRRWLSINGPFFSERGIGLLFLHTAQLDPLRTAHFLESAHRTRNAVRKRAEGAYESRPLRIRNLFYNHGPARLAQPQLNLRGRHQFRDRFYHRLRCTPSDRFPSARGTPCGSPGGTSTCSSGCDKVALCCLPRQVHVLFARLTECVAVRSFCCSCAFFASWRQGSENPKEFEDGFPSPALHRRRAGDPPDSWPRRGPWGRCHAHARGRPAHCAI